MLTPLRSAPLLATLLLTAATGRADSLVYFGTYTNTTSKGIYVSTLSDDGKLSPPTLAAESKSPSFLAADPKGKYLYSANESGSTTNAAGAVTSFSIDRATGKLTQLNEQSSQGKGPCHVAVDPTGKVLLAANYDNGSLASFPLAADGKIQDATAGFAHKGKSANPQRQEGPHAHCVAFSPSGQFALCADLGLDKIFSYRVNSDSAALDESSPPFVMMKPGSGPRHLAFHPALPVVWSINELTSTITTLQFDGKTGALSTSQSLTTLPADFKGSNSTAELVAHPTGRFVYGSNRGHDSIASWSVDPGTGWLRPLAHTPAGGKTPRGFGISPDGKWLVAAHQDSDTVQLFKLDAETGALSPSGTTLPLGRPVCVIFVKN